MDSRTWFGPWNDVGERLESLMKGPKRRAAESSFVTAAFFHAFRVNVPESWNGVDARRRRIFFGLQHAAGKLSIDDLELLVDVIDGMDRDGIGFADEST